MTVVFADIVSDKGNDLFLELKLTLTLPPQSGKHQHLVEICAEYLSIEV
jgi:hypothetical protein